MEGLVPRIVVTAIGSAALGAPEALRVMLTLAGQSPLVDIGICIFFIGMVTAHLLGVLLLARFVRKARAQAGAGGGDVPRPRAPATDCFAKMTLMVSVGVAFIANVSLVTASGALSSVHFAFDMARRSPVGAVFVIVAAVSLPFISMPLLRVFHEAGNNAGAAAPATRAVMTRTAYLTGLSLVVGICLRFFISFVQPGGLDALRPFHGFTNTFVRIGAAATVVGTVLLARIYLRTRNAAGNGSVPSSPSPATGAERFGKLRQNAFLLALVCITLAGVLSVFQYAYVPPHGRKLDGGKHACSA